jgi:hypothetical protein
MKKTLPLFLLAISSLLYFTRCDKIEDLITFELDYTDSISVPPFPLTDTLIGFFTPETSTGIQDALFSNGSTRDLLKTVSLQELSIAITNNTSINLSAIKMIEIWIKANNEPKKKIAFNNNVPESTGKTLELETIGDNIKEYLSKENYQLRIDFELRDPLTEALDLEIVSVFEITADLF